MFSSAGEGRFLKPNSAVCSAMVFLLWSSAISPNNGAKISGVWNVALNKLAYQGPATYENCHAGRAVDGRFDKNYTLCTYTAGSFPVWWLVDLQNEHWIHRVSLLNRGDDFAERLQNFTVDVFLEDPRTALGFPDILGKTCARRIPAVGLSEWVTLVCDPGPLIGRFVRVLKWGFGSLALCEATVIGFQCPAMVVRRFEQIPSMAISTKFDLFLGVFSSPMKCAIELHGQAHIKVYLYNIQDGRCYGYSSPSWSDFRDERWEVYREVEPATQNMELN